LLVRRHRVRVADHEQEINLAETARWTRGAEVRRRRPGARLGRVDDDDASDVEPPELVLPLEPELELDEEDEAGSGTDVGPAPKLDSAGASGLQASADNTVSAERGAIRRTRPS
jgi:hypothetical protein